MLHGLCHVIHRSSRSSHVKSPHIVVSMVFPCDSPFWVGDFFFVIHDNSWSELTEHWPAFLKLYRYTLLGGLGYNMLFAVYRDDFGIVFS